MTALEPEWGAIAKRIGADVHYLATACTPDDVIGVDLVMLLPAPGNLNGGGFAQIESSVPVGTLAVANLGSAMVQIQNGPIQGSPQAQGTGVARVGPGYLLSMPLGGDTFSFYGRAGEVVLVTRFKSARDPHAGGVMAPATFTVDANAGALPAGAVVYTAPWAGIIPAYLVDLTVTNTGATLNRVKMFDGASAATSLIQLEDIELGVPGAATQPTPATVVKSYAGGRLILSGILNAATVAGDAGNPKVSAGVF